MTDNLLVEIGVEELPPKALKTLSDAFTGGIAERLQAAQLDHHEITGYATPRRLAVIVNGLVATQPDRQSVRRGPSLDAAFDAEGNPTRAAQGFARSCGVEVPQLQRLENAKGSWLSYAVHERGAQTETLVAEMVRQSLAALPIAKRMRWGIGDWEFVRPVHWLVLLYGARVIEAEVLGLHSGRHTRGHRFHCPEPIELACADDYLGALEHTGKVQPSFQRRRALIQTQVRDRAAQCAGTAMLDDQLLDEITGLVEWPMAFSGSFDKAYLALPPEVLIATLKTHQRCFPVVDPNGALLAHFIGVSNIDSTRPETVRRGNERVVAPRLSDAQFFWQQDRRQGLAQRAAALKGVVFQKRLGTLYQKSQRVSHLAGHIAQALGGNAALATRAGQLAKCDLLTDMVGEFPQLQGTMGRYYASHDAEPEEVATALEEQYLPRFAGDRVPRTATGQALAIADKLDTVVGIFAIDQAPTGDKDPFALRRAALGVLRIVVEAKLDLDLKGLIEEAAGQFPDAIPAQAAVGTIFSFMMERLRRYYLDSGITTQVFEAVLARLETRPYDFHRRVQAVTAFAKMAEAKGLAAANKRVANILKKTELPASTKIDPQLLLEPAELALAEKLRQVTKIVTPKLRQQDYTGALTELAGLRDSVDQFFDAVMVMCEDRKLRDNRLALLNNMSTLFLQVADIARLQS